MIRIRLLILILLSNLHDVILVGNLDPGLLQHVKVEFFTVRDGDDDGIIETSLLDGWVPEFHQFVALFNVLTLVKVGNEASSVQLNRVDPDVDQEGNTAIGN